MSADENKNVGAGSPRPCRRRRWWVWPAFAAVLVCLTAAVLIHVFTRDTPLNRLKQQIRDEVPIGATRAQVEAWADEKWGRSVNATADPNPVVRTAPTILETAGVPADQRTNVLEITIPCGWYVVRNEVAQNQLWAFFPLNAQGEVTGRYFLTLEELAAMGR